MRKVYRLFEANIGDAEKKINALVEEGFELKSVQSLGVHGRVLVCLYTIDLQEK